jgi:hypothetical protein
MPDCCVRRGILREEARLITGDEEEELILGIHVYRILSPTRFACSLMPSGAAGIVEFSAISMLGEEDETKKNPLAAALPNASPEAPVTVVFQRAIPAPQIEWSSERKCFVCTLSKVQAFVI